MTRKYLLIAAVALVLGITPLMGLIPGWTPALATNVALTALALIGLNVISFNFQPCETRMSCRLS